MKYYIEIKRKEPLTLAQFMDINKKFNNIAQQIYQVFDAEDVTMVDEDELNNPDEDEINHAITGE